MMYHSDCNLSQPQDHIIAPNKKKMVMIFQHPWGTQEIIKVKWKVVHEWNVLRFFFFVDADYWSYSLYVSKTSFVS